MLTLIIKELEKKKIFSPTEKEKRCKRTIDVMRNISEMSGFWNPVKARFNISLQNNNPAIISKEVFEAVQTEKKRSNMVKDENGW